MPTEENRDNKSKENENNVALKPDQETLHTTDPQEHMEGPISSLMQKAEKGFEKEDTGDEDKKDSD